MTTAPAAVRLSPDVFSVVMATGILSIAAGDHHYHRVSAALDIAAASGLLVLVMLAVVGVRTRRQPAMWDLTDPDVTLRLFTFVAACAVLGSRFAGHPVPAGALGAIAVSAWLVLVPLTVRNMARCRWVALRDRACGAWELGSVGTSGLAVVTAQAARYTGHRFWLAIAVPCWLLALSVYGLMTWLVVWRAVAERRDRNGFAPDSWIMMGALAISTLAGYHIHRVVAGGPGSAVRAVTVVTWTLATLWIPPLIYFAMQHISRRPAALRFAGVWWALVFPLGMYSVATDAMSAELRLRSMQTVSLVFFWNASAVWLIVVISGLLRVQSALSRQSPPSEAPRQQARGWRPDRRGARRRPGRG